MNTRQVKTHPSTRKDLPAPAVFCFFLLLSYLITAIGLMLLAFLLYKMQLGEKAVRAGIILIYIISSFAASFFCGKKIKNRKFLWGLALGSAYFLILVFLSFIQNGSADSLGSNVATAFLLCAGSGMLGGMLA